MSTAVTVAEIGRRAGCSPATVSRALNGSGPVSPKVREAVLRAVREAEAMPAAASKRGRSTRVRERATQVGVIEVVYYRPSPFEAVSMDGGALSVGGYQKIRDTSALVDGRRRLSDSFWREMVDAAVAEASRWRRRSVLQFAADLNDREFLDELSRPDRCGVIVVGEPSDDLQTLVERCPHPLVLMDITYDGWPDVITTDNGPGIAAAFDHLRSLGHTRIGFGGRRDSNFAHLERYTAYKMKMAEADLPVRPEWVFEGLSQVSEAAAGLQAMLSRDDRPTALLCANDWVAIGALQAARAVGVRVPEDLSVVGFDDTDAALLATPALTTVRVPVEEIGRQAVRQLMIQVQAGVSERSTGVRIRVRPELVVRGSTAPVAPGR